MEAGSILTPPSPPRRAIAATVILVCGLAGAGAYSVHEHGVAKRLSAQNEQMGTTLKETRGQIDALTAKLNALSTPPPMEAAARTSPGAPVTKRVATRRRRSDDPRWKQVQSQLAEHQKAIESAQQELASARTELGGSIARTHEELVALQKKGERNYHEFDIEKTGQFERQGPVGLKLRKANTKHQYADLEMMVDDIKLSKKHVNLYEPVMFYPAGSQQAVELVINRITKNHIHGYVSEPKYRPSELAAMAAASNATNSATTSAASGEQEGTAPAASTAPAKPRRRLDIH